VSRLSNCTCKEEVVRWMVHALAAEQALELHLKGGGPPLDGDTATTYLGL
jgi:hypothetical protein